MTHCIRWAVPLSICALASACAKDDPPEELPGDRSGTAPAAPLPAPVALEVDLTGGEGKLEDADSANADPQVFALRPVFADDYPDCEEMYPGIEAAFAEAEAIRNEYAVLLGGECDEVLYLDCGCAEDALEDGATDDAMGAE